MPIAKSKQKQAKKPEPVAVTPQKIPLARYQTVRNIMLASAQKLNLIMMEEGNLFGKEGGGVWGQILQARDWVLAAMDTHDARTLKEYPDYVPDPKFSTDAVRGNEEFNSPL